MQWCDHHNFLHGAVTNLVPRPSTHPVLIACSIQKRRKVWEFHHMIRSTTVTCRDYLSTAKWCMRPILRSVLGTKMGQVPAESYTECTTHTKAKSHDSKRLPSDKCENTQQWHNHVV